MSRMWLKIAHYTKNKDNHNFGEKEQWNDANTEMNQMLGLSDKDFKEAIIKMLQSQLEPLEKKWIERSEQRNRSCKRKQNRNYINESYSKIYKTHCMCLMVEWMIEDRN